MDEISLGDLCTIAFGHKGRVRRPAEPVVNSMRSYFLIDALEGILCHVCMKVLEHLHVVTCVSGNV